MNGHVFAVELQDLDPRLSVLVKDGFGCCAVNDNGFRFQLFDGVLEASSEELAFALDLDASVGSNGDRISLRDTVAADIEGTLIAPANICDDRDAVFL